MKEPVTRWTGRHFVPKLIEIVAGFLFVSAIGQAIWQRFPRPKVARVNLDRAGSDPGSLRLAVVAHVYYPDLLPEIVACWANVAKVAEHYGCEAPVALLITTVADRYDDICEQLRSSVGYSAQSMSVHAGLNKGRDIAPFLALLNNGALQSYDVVLKLHTKRSPHLWTGNLRRKLLYAVLAGSERQVGLAMRQFCEATVGMVGWGLSWRNRPLWWMANRQRVQRIAGRMIPRARAQPGFFEGSMFWVRPAALAPLRSLGLTVDDFEPEWRQLDGALHHAIERAFALSVWSAGMEVRSLSGASLKPGPEPNGEAQVS